MGDGLDKLRGLTREEYFRQTRLGSSAAAAAEIRELAAEVQHTTQDRRANFAERCGG